MTLFCFRIFAQAGAKEPHMDFRRKAFCVRIRPLRALSFQKRPRSLNFLPFWALFRSSEYGMESRFRMTSAQENSLIRGHERAMRTHHYSLQGTIESSHCTNSSAKSKSAENEKRAQTQNASFNPRSYFSLFCSIV